MKYFGSTVAFTRQRNEELMRLYRRFAAEPGPLCMADICRRIADSPSPRFWVSEERAAVVISHLEAGRPISRMTPTKQLMFAEIHRRFRALRLRHPSLPIIELAAMVVYQPAPSFYLTPRTVGELICRIRNGYYDHPKYNPYS